MMPREYGFKSNSYEVDIVDDDIIESLPKEQQDQYIENKIAPQIEEQIKDIKFDNEDDKLKVYTQAVSNKIAKEWGTRHANTLNNLFSTVQLGLNAVVVVDSVSIPALVTAVADPFKYVRICDISDNVYDTERKDNNNATVLISKSVNTFTDFPVLKILKNSEYHQKFYQRVM